MNEESVEKYIDEKGLIPLLTMIENILSEKAEHLAVNWQDRTSAKQWQRAASIVYTAAKGIQEKTSIA
jgi:hypothetical protein